MKFQDKGVVVETVCSDLVVLLTRHLHRIQNNPGTTAAEAAAAAAGAATTVELSRAL